MTAEDIEVRPIAPGEEEAVVALWQASGLTRPWNDPRRDLEFARGKPGSDVLVGIAGGRLVAAVMVGHDGHRGTVYYLAADPGQRREGLGRAMLVAAEAWLLARGVWKINLCVRRGNEPVLGFYAAMGYEPQDVVMLGRWIDPPKKGG